MKSAAPALSRSAILLRLLLLTFLFGGANVVKPFHVDDAAYFYDARQIAAHPLDPYDTWLIWYQEPSHANDILAPPVVPYTWALGLRLFGDHPFACKLLLLPWALLLVYAVYSLARRFAAGLEWPVTILTILSPSLWPSLNFMLDIPALGLALMAVELFFRACDESSFFKAACAGLLVGVGFETKYTVCVALAAIVLASIVRRRLALGVTATLQAATVFSVWEFLMAVLYGRSHFFNSFAHGDSTQENRFLTALQNLVVTKGPLMTCLLSLLGSVTPALLLLGLLSLGVRRRWLVFTAMLYLGGVLSISLIYSHFEGDLTPSARVFGEMQPPPLKFELADVIFAVFGGVLLCVVGLVARALFRSSSGEARREVVFLLGWLGLEIAAYFPLTPFPAVRRVLGILIVMTLLIGRYAAQTGCPTRRRLPYARSSYSACCWGLHWSRSISGPPGCRNKARSRQRRGFVNKVAGASGTQDIGAFNTTPNTMAWSRSFPNMAQARVYRNRPFSTAATGSCCPITISLSKSSSSIPRTSAKSPN